MIIKRIMAVILISALAGCARTTPVTIPDLSTAHTPGALQKSECLGGYGATTFRFMLWWSGLSSDMPVRSGADFYRLQYWTTSYDGAATVASGLVAIPKKGEIRGVVSYQHGTRAQRQLAPSKPTLDEGVIVSALFAGGGYLLAAPDYLGFGVSEGLHPYVHAATEAGATVDLLKAAETFTRSLGKKWSPSIYLLGFSQGGHATMAAQRALESLNDPQLHVVASAPISGVYDLANITFPLTLEGKSTADSMYLAYLFNAYSAIYGKPLSDIVAAPYNTLIPILFDGKHTEDNIMATLPPKPREMLAPAFINAYDNGQPTWLLTVLGQNEVFQWKPNAPVRVYYGELDVDVSPKEAHALAGEFTKRGAGVTLVSVGDYDHGGSVLQAAPRVRAWFDEVSASTTTTSP